MPSANKETAPVGQSAKDGVTDIGAMGKLRNWIDRRFKPRFAANIPVVIVNGKSVQSALVCDLSETGFGLTKTTGLMEGDWISITLPDGRVCGGRVVWENEGRAGVSMIKGI